MKAQSLCANVNATDCWWLFHTYASSANTDQTPLLYVVAAVVPKHFLFAVIPLTKIGERRCFRSWPTAVRTLSKDQYTADCIYRWLIWYICSKGAEHTKIEGIPQYIYPYSVYYLYLVLKNNVLVLMWHIFTLKFFLEDMDFFLAFFCWQMLLNDLNISFNNVITAADCISPCCIGFINLQANSSRETFLSRHNRSTNEKIRRPLSFISPTRIQSLKLCKAG